MFLIVDRKIYCREHTSLFSFRFSKHFVGGLIFLAVLALLIWRLPLGIDFSDEAYYAIFIDDWLKGGIGSSTLTTIHQTAQLLPYAILRILGIEKTPDGMILWMRVMYLVASTTAALVLLRLLVRICKPVSAWCCAAVALSFIPFGLPAVSYNTIGLQGLIVALSALGIALSDKRLYRSWAVVSAVGWAISVTAYPSLGLTLAACVAILGVMEGLKKFAFYYVAVLIVVQASAWVAVINALSFERLLDSVAYLAAINDVDGWSRKIDYSFGLLASHRTFTIACTLSIVLGVFRQHLGVHLTSVGIAILVVILFKGHVALFCRSHDVVTVVSLTGIGLVTRMRRACFLPTDRVLGLIWLTGMAAGLTTMASAYHSILNFPVGAAIAAVASLAGLSPKNKPMIKSAVAAQAVVIIALLNTSLFYYYGSPPNAPMLASKISGGAFAGLRGTQFQAEALTWVQNDVAPLAGDDRSIAFVGWNYGLILATPLRPQMLAVPPLMNSTGLAINHDFFAKQQNRPSLVIIQEDVGYRPLNPLGPRFADWYEQISSKQWPPSTFTVYRRKPESIN
ncbi:MULTISPECIES: hypothetical protein [Agrobacterium]|uniref:hypothetical protein n=1 Tax=Agrobacterium TaxID=357 RepID=UPI001E2CA2A8|nr:MULTISPECIES: hypothetical protein [Agrobacterium]UHS58229.1 hypothetical protein HRS00_14915 [Agrobacterium vaccinii]